MNRQRQLLHSRKIAYPCFAVILLLVAGVYVAQAEQITTGEALTTFDKLSGAEALGFDLEEDEGVPTNVDARTREQFTIEQGWTCVLDEGEDCEPETAFVDALYVYGLAIEFENGNFLCLPPPPSPEPQEYNAARKVCMDAGRDSYFPGDIVPSLAAAEETVDNYLQESEAALVDLRRSQRSKAKAKGQTRKNKP